MVRREVQDVSSAFVEAMTRWTVGEMAVVSGLASEWMLSSKIGCRWGTTL